MAINGFRSGAEGLRRFLMQRHIAEAMLRRAGLAFLVLRYLSEKGGAVQISEMKLADRLRCSEKGLRLALASLVDAGAVVQERVSVGGLRLASVRRLSFDAALRFCEAVVAGVHASQAAVRRRLQARWRLRALRPLPSGRFHTVVAPVERLDTDLFSADGDPSLLLLRHKRGEVCLPAPQLAALVEQVAAIFGRDAVVSIGF